MLEAGGPGRGAHEEVEGERVAGTGGGASGGGEGSGEAVGSWVTEAGGTMAVQEVPGGA